jgi:hypothetical protein
MNGLAARSPCPGCRKVSLQRGCIFFWTRPFSSCSSSLPPCHPPPPHFLSPHHTTPPPKMATLLPPPKRQKLNNSHPRSVQKISASTEEERYVPQVIVQFKNAEDGALLGPAINLPADTNREALQMLVNKLRGEVSLPSCSIWITRAYGFCRMKTPFPTHSTSSPKSLNP